jgi:hypothetical protein
MSDVVNLDRLCNICGKEFDFPYLLDRHKSSKRKCFKKTTDYQCHYCGICCVNKYTLEKHFSKCKSNPNDNNDDNDDNDENNNDKTKSKSKGKNSKNNLTQDNMVSLVSTLLSVIAQNQSNSNNNELIQNMQQIFSRLQASNVNTENTNSHNNSTSNTNNTNNNNTNNINHSNNNNNINNTININNENNIIFPFQFEDINCLTDEENLEILRMKGRLIPILNKIYSHEQHFNHMKKNANKEFITTFDKNMNIKIYKSEVFYEKLAVQSINFLEQILHKYQPRLLFDHQLAVLVNIEELRNFVAQNTLANHTDFTDIAIFLEARFQNSLTKEIFKKFLEKMIRNTKFKDEQIKAINIIKKKMNTLINDIEKNTITDGFLRQEIWSIEIINSNDADPNSHYNNLYNYRFKATKRYKFFKERQNEEFAYFREHGIAIGNLYKYREILLERAKYEIERIKNQYEDSEYLEEFIEDVTKAMVNETNKQLLTALPSIQFIDNHNLIEEAQQEQAHLENITTNNNNSNTNNEDNNGNNGYSDHDIIEQVSIPPPSNVDELFDIVPRRIYPENIE